MVRASGILMPVASLPNRYGIGCFSKEAYEFVDFLENAGQSYWQMLPLGQTGYGDSPYQSFSTYAGNPYFIDLDKLIDAGFIEKKELAKIDFGKNPDEIDYEKIYLNRFRVLKKAYDNSPYASEPKHPWNGEKYDEEREAFERFISDNAWWLKDYCLYSAIKEAQGAVSYIEWDDDIRTRKPDAMKKYEQELSDEIRFYEFQQYEFALQWSALKKYANERNIKIIGDIPIYVAFDSADTWSNPELFKFDKKGYPTVVAGCPPDGFSATGQLWGNPIYDWEYHKKTGYEWWIRRIEHCFKLYDVLRIDHFRGFDEYYEIPYGSETAMHGEWVKGPGYELFKVMKENLGDKEVIAEDLGFLTPSVLKLVKKTGYPGMKVLQFAFDSREESDYLPYNYGRNCVVYTGTHDNQTSKGWYKSAGRKDKSFARRYMCVRSPEDAAYDMIRTVLSSVADTAIIPMQDYLNLGDEARINTPSTLGGNWIWRMDKDALTNELSEKIRLLSRTYGRIIKKKETPEIKGRKKYR
ncbi:MAG: 4-alpha-glucanotransferase [Lachnospiraceae bacterium]|nr:4-alpha-glucanotransferase [Lachnospiraceae bacterium]